MTNSRQDKPNNSTKHNKLRQKPRICNLGFWSQQTRFINIDPLDAQTQINTLKYELELPRNIWEPPNKSRHDADICL